MKIKDIVFIALVIYILTLINWDKETIKAIITGIVVTYLVMRRIG